MSTVTATRPAARPAAPQHALDVEPRQPRVRVARPEPEYRLTRRGRLVVLVAGVLVALAVGLVFAGGSVATGEAGETRVVVVEPGDTLWDLAADVVADTGADASTPEMMRHLQDLNDLDGVTLAAGQRLVVPEG